MTRSKKNIKKFKLKYLLLLPITGAVLVQLFLSCSLSSYGGEITGLLEKKMELERENQVLENQMAELSALGSIRERAELELGMSRAEVEFFSPSRQASLDEAAHLAQLVQ